MTDPNYTHVAIVLDRSGSMTSIRADAEGGLKEFIAEQKRQPGKLTLTVARFDTEYELRHRNVNIHDIDGITIMPRGATALLDAIGKTITIVGEDLAALDENERPGKVLFVIVTDGYENSSREWTREQVYTAITQQREVYDWEFIFLAADQDAIQAGTSMGIPVANNLAYAGTGAGARKMAASVSSYVTDYRKRGDADLQ